MINLNMFTKKKSSKRYNNFGCPQLKTWYCNLNIRTKIQTHTICGKLQKLKLCLSDCSWRIGQHSLDFPQKREQTIIGLCKHETNSRKHPTISNPRPFRRKTTWKVWRQAHCHCKLGSSVEVLPENTPASKFCRNFKILFDNLHDNNKWPNKPHYLRVCSETTVI